MRHGDCRCNRFAQSEYGMGVLREEEEESDLFSDDTVEGRDRAEYTMGTPAMAASPRESCNRSVCNFIPQDGPRQDTDRHKEFSILSLFLSVSCLGPSPGK